MKKLVIVFVVIAVLAVIGYVLFLKPVPEAFTPESAEKMALSSCTKDLQDWSLLLQAIESDETKCDKLGSDVFKYHCLAWFGKDFCANLAIEDEISCRVVLNRKSEYCFNDLCRGILRNETNCADPSCVALARRDKEGLAASVCESDVETAKESASCIKQAKDVKELEACRSA